MKKIYGCLLCIVLFICLTGCAQQEGGELTSSDNPYINVIAARTADKNNENYQKVVKAFQTQIVAEYLLTKFSEAYYPAFDYEEFTKEKGNQTVELIDNYESSSEGKTVIKVGVCGSSNDHWQAVQYVLDQQNANIYIELVVFSQYSIPNEALNTGDIDLNSFQHYAYLNNEISQNGYNITAIGETLIAPLTIYSSLYNSLDELKAAAASKKLVIAIPNDVTNGGRALKLLEKAGLIEVDSEAGYTPDIVDITKYNYNIEIVQQNANTLPEVLSSYDAVIINGTYAIPAGLVPSVDGLFIEIQG